MTLFPRRRLLLSLTAACFATAAAADFEAAFDDLDAGATPGGPWIVDGSVEATALGSGGNALRVRSEGNDSAATARRPVAMEGGEQQWTAAADWRPGSWGKPGVVLELTRPNANQRLFRVTTISGKNHFRASDFEGGAESDLVVGGEYKKDVWYRVTATGTLGEPAYALTIVERGRDNAADAGVVFDSAEGTTLRVNPAVAEPALIGFGVWRGQGAEGYAIDVDNVRFRSGDEGDAGAVDVPAEPE